MWLATWQLQLQEIEMMTDRVAPERVERVAVLGAGTIGASWTTLFLARGMAVEVFDIATDVERSVRGFVDNAWPALERLQLAKGADPAGTVRNFVLEAIVMERGESSHGYREGAC
jgi:hypothetical protein